MTIVHVQVPLNMRVGQTFMVEHAGQRVQIQVPPGVRGGQTIGVDIPAPAPRPSSASLLSGGQAGATDAEKFLGLAAKTHYTAAEQQQRESEKAAAERERELVVERMGVDMEKHRLEIRKEIASYKKEMQAMHVTTGDANTRAAARWRGKLGPAEAADVSSLLDAILQHHTTNKKLREVEDFTKRGAQPRLDRAQAEAVLACIENSLRHPQVLAALHPKLDPAAQRWADGVIKAPQSATTKYG